MKEIKKYYAWQIKVGKGALEDYGFMSYVRKKGINALKEENPILKDIAESKFFLSWFENDSDNIINNLVTVRIEIRA